MGAGLGAPAPRRTGDQFYLCAHDLKGRPRLTPRAIELGAASAVLGDLVIDDYLAIIDDRVQVRERGWKQLEFPRVHRRPTVVRWLLEQINGSPTVVLRNWITHIAPLAPQWIAHHLESGGVVRQVQPSWFVFWSTTTRYEPIDLNEPHKLGDHLELALHGHSSLTVADVFLAGLLQATQLHRTVIAGIPHLDDLITAQVRALTDTSAHARPSVREASLSALLTHTRQLVDTAVLAQTL